VLERSKTGRQIPSGSLYLARKHLLERVREIENRKIKGILRAQN